MSETPKMRIMLGQIEGRGHVRFSFLLKELGPFLAMLDVATVDELTNDDLRGLCSFARSLDARQMLEEHEQNGGEAKLLIDDASGGMELRSSDIGYALLGQFVPRPAIDLDTLCDPVRNSVVIELHVLDIPDMAGTTGDECILGATILQETIEPLTLG
jgi:hypothetical protein